MHQRRAKVAFSIDANLLVRVEHIRASTGESRSAVISRAIAKLTSEKEYDERVRRYVAAYQEQPEDRRQVGTARRSARRVLARLPWEDR
jgi:metal-responsive CopG/Arc/MetJ family transcriptional regulator